MLTFERIGEVLTCVIVLVFSDFLCISWNLWLKCIFTCISYHTWYRTYRDTFAAQVISLEETDMYSYRDAYSKAQANGEDTSELENAYKQYESDKNLVNLMNLRNKVYQYRLIEIEDKATWMAVVSPYFGVDDLRWFFIQLKDFGEYVKRNQQLFDFTFDFNIYDYGLDYEMPVYFISGSCDWVCPVDPICEYAQVIQAPNSDFLVIDGPGHNLQYSTPMEFADVVKYVLEQ